MVSIMWITRDLLVTPPSRLVVLWLIVVPLMEMLDLALSANVSGVHDDHKLSNLFPFVGLVQYQYGFAVAIIPHVSYHGKIAPFS